MSVRPSVRPSVRFLFYGGLSLVWLRRETAGNGANAEATRYYSILLSIFDGFLFLYLDERGTRWCKPTLKISIPHLKIEKLSEEEKKQEKMEVAPHEFYNQNKAGVSQSPKLSVGENGIRNAELSPDYIIIILYARVLDPLRLHLCTPVHGSPPV